jgi:hypothetical protein
MVGPRKSNTLLWRPWQARDQAFSASCVMLVIAAFILTAGLNLSAWSCGGRFRKPLRSSLSGRRRVRSSSGHPTGRPRATARAGEPGARAQSGVGQR